MIKRFTKDISIAVIAAIIIGLVIPKIQISQTEAILTSIIVALIAIAIWLTIQAKKESKVGIKNVYANAIEIPSFSKLVHQATTSFEFIGISARTFFEEDGMEEILEKKIREGVSFNIRLLDPSSPTLDDKAKHEGGDANAWRYEIASGIARFQKIQKKTGKIDIKIYKIFPIWRCIIIDDDSAYVSFYPEGHSGKSAPVLLLKKNKNSLFNAIRFYVKYHVEINMVNP